MKNLIAIFLFFISLMSLQGQELAEQNKTNVDGNDKLEQPQQRKLNVTAILTLSDPNSIFRQPNDAPFLVALKKVHRNEFFKYLPLIENTVANDGDAYKLQCSLSYWEEGCSDRIMLIDKQLVEGVLDSKDASVIFPLDLMLKFEESDKLGDYNIEYEVVNLNTQEQASCVNQISLVDWEHTDFGDSNLDNFIFNYNTNFNTEALYASLFSKDLSFYKKLGMDGFDPMLISYYKHAVAEQDFLYDILAKNFEKLSEQERLKVIMLNAFSQREPFAVEVLDSQELIFQNYIENEFDFTLDPYEGELLNAYSLDILLGEFFAKGNYAPVARILEAFKYRNDAVYALKIHNQEVGDPVTDAEVLSYKKGRIFILANNYLKRYISNPLLQRYLLWTLFNTSDENAKESIYFLLYNNNKENKS